MAQSIQGGPRPRDGYRPRRVTDKRGGQVDPLAEIRTPVPTPPLGQTPKPQNTTPPRKTPRDTDPSLVSRKVEPVATRPTPRANTDNPF